VKELRWDLRKDERLRRIRGVSFDDLINSRFIIILDHPARKNQKIMLFEYKRYIWAVPCVEEDGYYFLKILFPSRKYTKQFKGEIK
jgi:hypothetical protein